MLKGQDLELGHSFGDGVVLADHPDVLGDRIEHRECNRKAGLLAGQLHSRYKPSRDW